MAQEVTETGIVPDRILERLHFNYDRFEELLRYSLDNLVAELNNLEAAIKQGDLEASLRVLDGLNGLALDLEASSLVQSIDKLKSSLVTGDATYAVQSHLERLQTTIQGIVISIKEVLLKT